MSSQRVNLVILCEDSQQLSFANRFFHKIGWQGDIRFSVSPKADGSAEQYVRVKFPEELKWYRQHAAKAATAFLAIIDADKKTAQGRIDEFAVECANQGVEYRKNEEAVALAIPGRNIETWIRYLNGEQVNEITEYSKLSRPRGCKSAVDKLVELCHNGNLPGTAPESLKTTCIEYTVRLKPLIK